MSELSEKKFETEEALMQHVRLKTRTARIFPLENCYRMVSSQCEHLEANTGNPDPSKPVGLPKNGERMNTLERNGAAAPEIARQRIKAKRGLLAIKWFVAVNGQEKELKRSDAWVEFNPKDGNQFRN